MKKVLLILIMISLFSMKSVKLDSYVLNTSNMSAKVRDTINEAIKSWPVGLDIFRPSMIVIAGEKIDKGIKYLMGGSHAVECPVDPQYFDCSSYVAYNITTSEIDCSWDTSTFVQSELFTTIEESELEPGDIGLNSDTLLTGANNHIGIYVGKTADGQNIWFHASSGGPQIRIGNGNFTFFRKYIGEPTKPGFSFSASSELPDGVGGEIKGLLEDKYPQLNYSITNNKDTTCETIFYNVSKSGETTPTSIKKLLDNIYFLITVITPCLTILLSILDYREAIQNQNNFSKVNKKVVKRLLLAILILLIPSILELVFHIFGLYDLSNCGIS